MRYISVKHRNRSIRLVMSVAVLFYALLPQTGFCACDDCHCENKLPSAETAMEDGELDAPKSCCCQAQGCCSTSQEDSEGLSSTTDGSCSCSCSTTKDTPPPSQDLTFRSTQVLEEFKFQFHSIVAFLPQPEVAVEADRPVDRFDRTVARLPIRLHLLLLVLLN